MEVCDLILKDPAESLRLKKVTAAIQRRAGRPKSIATATPNAVVAGGQSRHDRRVFHSRTLPTAPPRQCAPGPHFYWRQSTGPSC